MHDSYGEIEPVVEQSDGDRKPVASMMSHHSGINYGGTARAVCTVSSLLFINLLALVRIIDGFVLRA